MRVLDVNVVARGAENFTITDSAAGEPVGDEERSFERTGAAGAIEHGRVDAQCGHSSALKAEMRAVLDVHPG